MRKRKIYVTRVKLKLYYNVLCIFEILVHVLFVSEKYLPEEMLADMEEMLDSTLNNILEKYDVNYQIKQAHNVLKDQWDRIDGISLFCKV